MDREQMKLAIMKQEQTFRQQVHELHRLYHVQRQLMQQQTQLAAAAAAPATINYHATPIQEFRIVHGDNKPMTNPEHLFGQSSSNKAVQAPAPDDEPCSLELTLATGPSSSSSSSGSAAAGTGGGRQLPGNKRLQTSSNSNDSGTAVSSTSTDSELALFGEVDVARTAAVRFQSEARRMDEVRHQGAWMYQCLSLRTA